MNSDYSCYVHIINNTNQTLNLGSQKVIHGSYVTAPPNTIAIGQSIMFQVQGSNFGPVGYGGQGECQYNFSSGDTNWFRFTYQCPHLKNDNSASAQVSSPNLHVVAIPDPIPTGGHPVRIQFILSNT